MTKKHYEAIAFRLKYRISDEKLTRENMLSLIAESLADYFQTDNAKFDRARFLQACGIKPNK